MALDTYQLGKSIQEYYVWYRSQNEGKQDFHGPTLFGYSQWLLENNTAHQSRQEYIEKYPHVLGRRNVCLTGEEWLKRFLCQIDLDTKSNNIHLDSTVLQAASKASGVESPHKDQGGDDE